MLFEKQDYQIQCVQNIVNLLSGYDFQQNSPTALKENLLSFHKTNPPVDTATVDKTKLDILMETGTGKTFTYLKTMYELHRHYKTNKFVVFVPRKAIREGVLQNIALTADYFFQEYGKRLVKYTYDGRQSLSSIQNQYLHNNDELSVLVLTNSSIDKDTNILKSYNENLYGFKSVFDALKKAKPIIFIDEPHLLKGEEFTKVFSEFDSLYFRFGATFPSEPGHKLSNVIYCLDSLTSFRKYLVKKIRVHTIINAENSLKLLSSSKGETVLLYFRDNEEYKKIIADKADIGQATGLKDYNGIFINKSTSKGIFLSNGQELKANQAYTLHDEEIRLMIRKTIEQHFAKEERFFDTGVKTLSLFFIPNIEDFRGNKPKIKTIFEEEYKIQHAQTLKKAENPAYGVFLKKDFDENGLLSVHEGYFSGDKGSKEDKEVSGIQQILNEKELLLSFRSNLRFIFSVWALQEGWDNPNIFQICKLSSASSETSRRQQVGRGLRICVNQEGKRLTHGYLGGDEQRFYGYNTLDVIVSGHEKNFIEEIQREITDNSFTPFVGNTIRLEDFARLGLKQNQVTRLTGLLESAGVLEFDEAKDVYIIQSPLLEYVKNHREQLAFFSEADYAALCEKLAEAEKAPPVENANKPPKIVKIRQENFKKFQNLWETINRKASIVYEGIEETSLIENICSKFAAVPIPPVQIRHEVREYNAHTNEIIYKEGNDIQRAEFFKEGLQPFIRELSKDEGFPLPFILRVVNGLDPSKIRHNPRQAKAELTAIIKDCVHQSILQKVNYQFSSEIRITSLQDDNGRYKTALPHTALGRFYDETSPKESYLYDSVVYDSAIERGIILGDPETVTGRSVTVYAKLPKISIPTPYKAYNPDFAYLIESPEGKTFFLIVEAKGYASERDIPSEEKQKIEYGYRFFEQLQKELPHIPILYKTRINHQELSGLLQGLEG